MESQESREVQEPLGSDHVGSGRQAEESGPDSDGLRSHQCGVVRDAFRKVLLAAEGGPRGCWREEPCTSRHWTWGKDLGNATV